MANYDCVACESCDSLTLPTIEFDECDLETTLSEIQYIILGLPDTDNPGQVQNGPIDMTDPSAIETAQDTDIVILEGKGDMPEPEQDIQDGPGGRKIFGEKNFTVNFSIMDTNSTNYSMLRALECNPIYNIWYVDRGGYVYGGGHGIKAQVTAANNPKERGENSYNVFDTVYEWSGYCLPEREVYGLADNIPST